MRKRIEFVLEWGSTLILFYGVFLTSRNIYPANVYFSLAGNFGWFLIALLWRKPSLIVIQIFMTLIYLNGLYETGVFNL